MRRTRGTPLAALLLVAGALAVAAGAAGAPPAPEEVDPSTPVSNKGRVAPPPAAPSPATEETSYEGTGELSPDTAHDTGGPLAGDDVGIETVIGTDDRTRVWDTTTWPSRAVAHITSSLGGCTGWLIGANTVATAGHCVHSGGSGGSWATNVRVYPGRNGSSLPYGSCGYRALYTVHGWATDRNERYDYGAIKLNCTVGNQTGWFGFFWTSDSLTGLPTVIKGYPGDKTYGTQWRSADEVRVTQARQIFYLNDTYRGMSGSPVYYNRSGCGYCGMAIHAYGLHGSWPHSSYNHGTRITEDVFNNLRAWKNA